MYKLCIYNDGKETNIHYPSADKEAPHLSKMDLQEKDNNIDSFSFSIENNNPGYNLLSEFKTKVKIIDIRDNSIRFIGRLLKAPEQMDSTGKFYKQAQCESALAYLLDSSTRAQSYLTSDISSALTDLLNRHNAIVEDDKKIYLGTVDVAGNIAYTCQFEPTLNAILNMLKDIKCHLQVRETNGLLYLDCLQQLSSTIIEVKLGENMKELIKTKDTSNIATRIIPLGANNLTISSVNGGLDYIEDSTAKGLYGVIEKTVQYSNITDATELLNKATADINNYTQPILTFEISADDLSFITNIPSNVFKKGIKLHIVNPVMAIDDIFDLVQVNADLTKVYNPKLTISNIPTKIQDIICNMQNTAIQNDGVYNNVQIGDSFGVRVARNDGKIVTTLNATDCISIENLIKNLKVFFVDADGNVIHDGKQQATDNGKVLIENWKNANGGSSKIYDTSGNLNVRMGSESGASENIGGTLVLYLDAPNEDYADAYRRVEAGISKTYLAGLINLRDSSGIARACLYANSNLGPVFAILDSSGNTKSYIAETSGQINDEVIATQNYVDSAVNSAISTIMAWVSANFQPKTT